MPDRAPAKAALREGGTKDESKDGHQSQKQKEAVPVHPLCDRRLLLLLDAAAFTLACAGPERSALSWGSFALLALTLIAVWQLASLSKSINKFYQTMEKQLSHLHQRGACATFRCRSW